MSFKARFLHTLPRVPERLRRATTTLVLPTASVLVTKLTFAKCFAKQERWSVEAKTASESRVSHFAVCCACLSCVSDKGFGDDHGPPRTCAGACVSLRAVKSASRQRASDKLSKSLARTLYFSSSRKSQITEQRKAHRTYLETQVSQLALTVFDDGLHDLRTSSGTMQRMKADLVLSSR